MWASQVERDCEKSLRRSRARRAEEVERERLSMFHQPLVAYFVGALIAAFVLGYLLMFKVLIG